MSGLTERQREELLIASHTVEPVQDTGRALFAVVERLLADAETAGRAAGWRVGVLYGQRHVTTAREADNPYIGDSTQPVVADRVFHPEA